MSWFQLSHVRIKNKVIQETYIRDSCFEVITFYWIQSENVVWLANPTLGFEITVLPVCSNQWAPFSHELLLICIPQSNINSFSLVFQFHYGYFISEISAVWRFIYELDILLFNSFIIWAKNRYHFSLSNGGIKVTVLPIKLVYEQLNVTVKSYIRTHLAFEEQIVTENFKQKKQKEFLTSIYTKN